MADILDTLLNEYAAVLVTVLVFVPAATLAFLVMGAVRVRGAVVAAGAVHVAVAVAAAVSVVGHRGQAPSSGRGRGEAAGLRGPPWWPSWVSTGLKKQSFFVYSSKWNAKR